MAGVWHRQGFSRNTRKHFQTNAVACSCLCYAAYNGGDLLALAWIGSGLRSQNTSSDMQRIEWVGCVERHNCNIPCLSNRSNSTSALQKVNCTCCASSLPKQNGCWRCCGAHHRSSRKATALSLGTFRWQSLQPSCLHSSSPGCKHRAFAIAWHVVSRPPCQRHNLMLLPQMPQGVAFCGVIGKAL